MQESNEEQEELIHLIREYKLSELILIKKKNELANENNKFKQLNNLLNKIKYQNKQNEINISTFNEEIRNLTLINKQIEKDNEKKKENLEILFKKFNEGKSIPAQGDKVDDNDKDSDISNSNIEDYKIENI